MSFSDYLYFALLYTSVMALPGALVAMPVAIRHYRSVKFQGHPKAEIAAAGYAILVSAGIFLHALEEVLYKSGRVMQFLSGMDTTRGATLILDLAAFLGIASLSLAVHYLNQTGTIYKRVYWSGHASMLVAYLLF